MTEIRYRNGKNVIENWDRVFRALSEEPRRQLIVSLLDAPPDEPAPLPESAINPNVPVDLEVLEMKLRHNHLPMLANMGFVEWDTDPFVAFRGPKFDEVAVVFDALHTSAKDMPDQLVVGCQRLEQEQQQSYRD